MRIRKTILVSILVLLTLAFIFFFPREKRLLWKFDASENLTGVSLSENGDLVAINGDEHVYVLNKSGKVIWNHYFENCGYISGVALSPPGNLIAIPSIWRGVMIGRRDEGYNLQRLEFPCIPFVSVFTDSSIVVAGDTSVFSFPQPNLGVFDHNGKLLWEVSSFDVYSIAASRNGEITVASMDIDSGGVPSPATVVFSGEGKAIGMYPIVGEVAVSSDGRTIVALGESLEQPKLLCLKKSGDNFIPFFFQLESIGPLSLSSDGRYIAYGQGENIYMLKTENFELVRTYRLESPSSSLALSSDGRFLAAAGNDKVYFFDRERRGPLWVYETMESVRAYRPALFSVSPHEPPLRISSDGGRVAVIAGRTLYFLKGAPNSRESL